MKYKLIIADLTHTGVGINADVFPFGIGLIGAYAKQELGDTVDISLHKFPEQLNEELKKNIPHVLAMSTYAWNSNLTYAFAAHVKQINPDTVIVFGGPDFPLPQDERRDYLLEKPAIDFIVKWDGEYSFTNLIKGLIDNNFNVERLKKDRIILNNLCYINADGEYIEGPDERVQDLMTVPSPYMTGLLDKFFDSPLVPVIETTRGCPYSCTFCNDGSILRNKVFRKNTDFVRDELEYIASRVKNTNQMFMVDLNFGMYKHDIETAKIIRSMIDRYQWPERIESTMGKSHPERLLEVTSIVNEGSKGVIKLGASLQSSDRDVLQEIKRKNLSVDELLLLKEGHSTRGNTTEQFFTELIIPLPGLTIEKHFGDLRNVVDRLEMNNIDVHQLTMLKGSEMATRTERHRLKLDVKHRVFVGCLGTYTLGDETQSIAEVEEVVMSTNTMTHDQYIECRIMDFLTKVFIDNDSFTEIFGLIKKLGLSPFDALLYLNQNHIHDFDSLTDLLDRYKNVMDKKLFDTYSELKSKTSDSKKIQEFVSGEYGMNELLTCRVLAYRECWEDLNIAFKDAILNYIDEQGKLNQTVKEYVEEVFIFNVLRRFDLRYMNNHPLGKPKTHEFHFDFIEAEKKDFKVYPNDMKKQVKLKFYYDDTDITYINNQIDRWGKGTLHQMGKFIQKSNSLRTRRKVSYAE